MTHCHVTCHMTWSISGSNAIPSRTHNSHDSCTCISMYTVWHDSCPDLFPAATQYYRALTYDLTAVRDGCHYLTHSRVNWLIIWTISVWHNSRHVTCLITWSISGSNSMPSGTDIWHDSYVWCISWKSSISGNNSTPPIMKGMTWLTTCNALQLTATHCNWYTRFYTANYKGNDMTDNLLYFSVSLLI